VQDRLPLVSRVLLFASAPLLLFGLLAFGYSIALRHTGAAIQALKLPAGFSVGVFADGVANARSLAFGSNGTLFVGSRTANKVYALVDRDHDGKADQTKVLISNLIGPNGVAVRDGALYVAAGPEIYRYDDVESRLDAPPAPVTIAKGLPDGAQHGFRFIGFGPDGLLYVSLGAPCNVCESQDERIGTIVRMNADGSGQEIVARGIRNSVGFDWHPMTHDLWFTDNGRDNLGDNLPSDELNVAPTPGLNFGFPYCHQGDSPDPQFGARHACSEFTPPALKFGAHVAAIGMRFYTGTMFPAAYRNAAFVAQHGSWNSTVPVGYRVMMVRTDGRKATAYEPFVQGFLQPDGTPWGRPADVIVAPDGALLISDDSGGRIFRVTYSK